MIRKETNN